MFEALYAEGSQREDRYRVAMFSELPLAIEAALGAQALQSRR